MMYMFRTNDALNPTINSRIVEYDIKSGNTSVMEYFQLRTITLIEELKSLGKKERVVAIGNMMREDKEFSKKLEESFNKIVELFIQENHLSEDDIVSIKRDAVFVKMRENLITDFGTSVHFIPKNEYVGFIKLKNIEFWIKDKNGIDVKGIDDELLHLHENGMLSLIRYIYENASKSGMDKVFMNRIFSEVLRCYKNRELEFDVYREFNPESKFKILMMNQFVMMDTMTETMIDRCDIRYNFENILIPLIRMFC